MSVTVYLVNTSTAPRTRALRRNVRGNAYGRVLELDSHRIRLYPDRPYPLSLERLSSIQSEVYRLQEEGAVEVQVTERVPWKIPLEGPLAPPAAPPDTRTPRPRPEEISELYMPNLDGTPAEFQQWPAFQHRPPVELEDPKPRFTVDQTPDAMFPKPLDTELRKEAEELVQATEPPAATPTDRFEEPVASIDELIAEVGESLPTYLQNLPQEMQAGEEDPLRVGDEAPLYTERTPPPQQPAFRGKSGKRRR